MVDYGPYMRLIYNSIKNDDFNSRELTDYSFVYYNFLIDGKWYTNLPDDSNTEELISIYVKENINDKGFLSESDIRYLILNELDEVGDEEFVEGYIYIDMSNNLYGYLQYSIRDNLKLQSILYFDCAAFIVLIVVGLILFFKNLKCGQIYISNKLDSIPIDLKFIFLIFFIAIILLFSTTYIKFLKTFSFLRRRITSFCILTVFTTFEVTALSDMLCIIRINRDNYMELKRRWDERYLKKVPVGLSLFILMVLLYISIYTSMLIGFKVSSYDRYFFIRENIYTMATHFIIMILLSLAISKAIKVKNLYTNRVLSEIKEIASGNLEKDVSVVGKDEVSDIAENVNLIKREYIRAIEEQKKSERLKYELITNISHDLRSPLTSIINYLDLSKICSSEEQLKRYLEAAESNSKILLLLIEDLFELSKMESGNVKLSKTNIDLILLLKQVAYEYNIICENENKEIILESVPNEIQYFCDSLGISRVFNNLIDNAVKYSLPNTRIYILVTCHDKEIVVEVKNISSYKLDFDLNELFLRFKRGDESRTSEGTGLGLAIAKGIVFLHDGNITLKNDGDLFKAIVSLPIE
jgi:signal transduction histidine kinase